MAVDLLEGAYQYGHPKTAQTSISPLAHVPAKWGPVRRQGHAPTRESTALPGDIGSVIQYHREAL